MVSLLALLVAVAGLWAVRRTNHGNARALADAGTLALILACAAGGAWMVAHWRHAADGTPGALAGVVVGVLLAQLARDLVRR